MNIGLIGSVVLDRINTFDGSLTESFGGVFYGIAVFEALMSEDDRLYPITPVGSDLFSRLIPEIRSLEKIDTSGLYEVDDQNNRVTLHYYTEHDRTEKLESLLPPVEYDWLRKFFDIDLLLFNLISGFDVTLDTIRKVRTEFSGTMFIDVHSLVLGIDSDGVRVPKSFPEWRDWVSCFDIVQMNRPEAQILCGEELSPGILRRFARELFDCGIRLAVITLGEDGCCLMRRSGGEINVEEIPAPERVINRDPTGCGDAFSVAFILSYLSDSDPLLAARRACSVAGKVATVSGIDDIMQCDLRSAFENPVTSVVEEDTA